MTETWEHFYQSLDITPISLGPNTQLKIMLSSIKAGAAPATLKKVTYRQLVKAAATVRNQTVTYGGVTALELAFGRRPADLIQLDVATPTQLTIDRNEEEMTAIQIKQLSKQAFQEAHQSEDIRQNLRMSSKPLQVKDKVFYWHQHQLLSQHPQCHYASREKQLPSLQHLIRQRTCSSRTPHPFLNKHIGIVYVKGRFHVLEIFAGSARFSQCCALSGLKVGTPVDIRTGFDVMTSKGRHMVMEIIKEQAPDVILMAPVCGPLSNMQNIQQDQQRVWEQRKPIFPWLSLWHPLRDVS